MARQVAFDDVRHSASFSSDETDKEVKWWHAWARKFHRSGSSESATTSLDYFDTFNSPRAAYSAKPGFSRNRKQWGTCKTLLAHLIVIFAFALGDLVYATEHNVEDDLLSTLLLALLYMMLAIALVVVAFLYDRFSTLWLMVQGVMHTGILFFSAHWRHSLQDDHSHKNSRLATLFSIWQLLMMVLYRTPSSDCSFLCLAAVIAGLLFHTWSLSMSVWSVGTIEDLLTVTAVGIACILSPKNNLRGLREDLTPLLRFDVELKESKKTATTDTHLQQLLKCIARVKQILEERDDDICELLCVVLGSISHELRSPSLLQINQDLSDEPAMTAAFVQATFVQTAFSADWFCHSAQSSMDDLSKLGGLDEEDSDKQSSNKHKSMGSRRTSYGTSSADTTLAGFNSEKTPSSRDLDAVNLEHRVVAFLDTLAGEDYSTSLSPRLDSKIAEDLGNGLGKWDFDILTFSELHRFPLLLIGQAALARYAHAINVDTNRLASFLSCIESRYEANPYHSAVHGASVLNGMLNFVQLKRTPFQALDSFDKFVGLVACAAHDVGHNGSTNRFHMIASTPFALLFNDQSILENMHCALMFATMERDSSNFLLHLNDSKRAEFRNISLDMILGTDLAKHMQLLSKFRQTFLASIEAKESLNPLQYRKDMLAFALKCIDVGHATMTFSMHARWSLRITTEFFRQGDREHELGLPCSPFCDRHGTKIAESQRGFFDFIVTPLYLALDEFADSSRVRAEVLSELRTNHAFWKNYDGVDFNYSDPMANLALLRAVFGQARRDQVVIEPDCLSTQRRHTLLGIPERASASRQGSRSSFS